MPYLEFQCKYGHKHERFFTTISAGASVNEVDCIVCSEVASKVVSLPMPAHLYGNPDGYYKPSPTKRFSNKTISKKEGNGT